MGLQEVISGHEVDLRLAGLPGTFGMMAVWEAVAPRRALQQAKSRRWIGNLGQVVLNSLMLRLVFPTAGVGMALYASANGWGLFNHVSKHSDETNRNFGFNLPWWDRLFGTYRGQPRDGHEAMAVGINMYRDARWCIRFPGLLSMPFARGCDSTGDRA
jgi:hypothetical protein